MFKTYMDDMALVLFPPHKLALPVRYEALQDSQKKWGDLQWHVYRRSRKSVSYYDDDDDIHNWISEWTDVRNSLVLSEETIPS